MNGIPSQPTSNSRWNTLGAVAMALLLAAAMSLPAVEGRTDHLLSDGWRFTRTSAPLDQASDTWPAITVPHTWNAEDVLPLPSTGKDSPRPKPYRGPGSYARTLTLDPTWKDRRIFVRFEAASLVARVYLNGQDLGEHRGAFTAFCMELTPHLNWDKYNELRVLVDNTKVPDVAPLQGDFNVQGGIYRPVHLLVTSPTCVSPLDYGSAGVYITQTALEADHAEVNVRTVLDQAKTSTGGTIITEVLAADGAVVATATETFTGTDREHTTRLNLPQPHRWQAPQDPYLYTCRVSLRAATGDDAVLDRIDTTFGLRTVAMTNEQGFLLNGKPYPIHGVNRRDDIASKGWAISPADDDRDVALMTEMGTTAVRQGHWPAGKYFHDLSDRTGLLLWDEVPLVEASTDSPAFTANVEMQLREMVLQHYNHPSVAFWGIFNELQGDFPRNAILLQKIKTIIQELDKSRLIVAASFKFDNPTNLVADWTCWNKYPGWYHGKPGELGASALRCNKEFGRRVGISEYGAGGNTTQHQEDETIPAEPRGIFHPEEYQAYNHERNWESIQNHQKSWGTFIWNMFDFTAANRNEGGFTGLNDKGMVTYDRSIKKDAFFFYKANWNPEPMLHLCSKRFTNRKSPTITVKAYCNAGEATLIVNGTEIGKATPDAMKILRWATVPLRPGPNEVVVRVVTTGKALEDRASWNLE